MLKLNSLKPNLKFNDPKILKQVFLEYDIPLRCFAFKYLNDQDISEDIVQDLFIHLWENQVEIKSQESLKSFLYTSVKNRCLNYIQTENRKNKNLIDLKRIESNTMYEQFIEEEDLYSNMLGFISELPKKSQQIMLMALNDISNSDISEELNISKRTVEAHKNTAYKKIKEKFKNLL